MIDSPRKLSPITMGIMFALYVTPAVSETLPTLDETTTDSAQVESSTKLDKQDLQEAPHNNPTISQALQHEPRVGIDDGQNSLRGGDLAPEEISLSGARPHQTKYTIGGVGVNNITTFADGSASNGSLSSGHTSGYFLDTTLLDSVDVMDHNISPEFGGFTGGVINAELRKPTDEFAIEYQYRMTDSDWNADPKVPSNLHKDFNKPMNGQGKFQPDYQKRMHSLHISGPISQNQQLALNISKQVSDIPLEYNKNVDQDIDNLFLTHIWKAGNWRTTSDFRYSGYKDNSFMNDPKNRRAPDAPQKPQLDSNMEGEHSGIGGTIKVERFTNFGLWETTLSYDRLSDKRESVANYLRNNFDASFNNYLEGGLGDIEQYQDSAQFKTVTRFDPVYWGATKHSLDAGLELAKHEATTKRKSEHVSFVYFEDYRGTGSPLATNMTHYEAGSYSSDTKQYSLFYDYTLEWRQLTLNLGGRLDHNDLFDETVFAPRSSVSWDFSQDKTNRITLGASRYYSSSLLGWALKAQGNRLKSNGQECTPINGNWDSNDKNNYSCNINRTYETASLENAETPYADELSATWAVDVDNYAFETTYVYREQRKGLSLDRISDTEHTLLNNMKSDTRIASLNISTIKPYAIAGGYLKTNLNVAYSDRKGHGNTLAPYDDDNNLNTAFDEDEWVLLDGKLMRTNEMKTSGYQSPVKSTLATVMYWPQAGVTWNNRVNYKQGKDYATWTGFGQADTNGDGKMESVKSMTKASMDDLVTWDMAVNWTPTQINNHMTIGVSVTNLLDESAEVSTSGMKLGKITPTESYNKGREVWLNLTVRN